MEERVKMATQSSNVLPVTLRSAEQPSTSMIGQTSTLTIGQPSTLMIGQPSTLMIGTSPQDKSLLIIYVSREYNAWGQPEPSHQDASSAFEVGEYISSGLHIIPPYLPQPSAVWALDESRLTEGMQVARLEGPESKTALQLLSAQFVNFIGYLVGRPSSLELTLSSELSASGAYTLVESDVIESSLMIDTSEYEASSSNQRYTEELLQAVRQYKDLKADWDGAHAAPISKGTLAHAESLVPYIGRFLAVDDDIRPSIGPMPDGLISFTWERDAKELWIFVDDKGFKSRRWSEATGSKSKVDEWENPDAITGLLDWLKT